MDEPVINELKRLQSAIYAQDGCNFRGIARSLVSMADAIVKEEQRSDAIRGKPEIVLMVAKLADMCGLDYTWPETRYRNAMAKVGKWQVGIHFGEEDK